jgi:hypothetical protein
MRFNKKLSMERLLKKTPCPSVNWCPSINEDFYQRSPAGKNGIKWHARKITTGIWTIFRGLFFEHNADIGQKDHL